MNDDCCDIGTCERPASMTYYDWAVCDYHWDRHCDWRSPFNLKRELGIKTPAERLRVPTVAEATGFPEHGADPDAGRRALAGDAAAWLARRKAATK